MEEESPSFVLLGFCVSVCSSFGFSRALRPVRDALTACGTATTLEADIAAAAAPE